MEDRVPHKSDYSKDEKYLTLLLCSIVGFNSISGTVITLIRKVVVLPYKLDTIFVNGILVFLFLYSIKLVFKRIRLFDYFFLLFFMVCMVISLTFSGNYNYFMSLGTKFIVSVVPYYLVCRCVRNFELAVIYLNVTALLITISQFLLLFVLGAGISEGYSQYSTYLILPAAIISANNFFRGKKVIHIANFFFAVFLIFSTGARGPLVCIILFIALKLVITAGKSVKNIVLIIVTTTTAILAVRHFLYDVLNYMRLIMVRHNLSVRLIDRLLANTFVKDSSRTSIANYAVKVIRDNPILGVGVGLDRAVIGRWIGQPEADFIGWYPHNIALELWMQFGIILGTIMIIAIIILFSKAIFGARDENERDIACIFAAIGLFPLFFSDSYLTSGLFFCAIAICLNICQSSANMPIQRR